MYQVLFPVSGGGKVRERLAVSKKTTHRVYIERFNLKKLSASRITYGIFYDSLRSKGNFKLKKKKVPTVIYS
jgi:hypothetical protein